MQQDGNFVVYKDQGAIWASNTAGVGTGPYILRMQSDNNLVVYDTNDQARWSSNTRTDHASANNGFVQMQDDGNLVVYRGDGIPLWKSGTFGGKSSNKMGTGYLLTGKIILYL